MKNSVSKQILHFRSVPAPLFQWLNNTKDYCAIMQQLNIGHPERLPNLFALQGSDRAAAFAALVCITNGCRISELLKLTNKSLHPSGLGYVPGSKGSNARQIFTFISPQVVAELAAAPEEFFLFNITYNTIYRVCKQVGLTLNIPGHANQAVTHQGRYLNASQATKSLGAAAASGVLGHRGRQTLQGYANPTETKAAVKRRKRQKLSHIEQQKVTEERLWNELCAKIANGEVKGPVYYV